MSASSRLRKIQLAPNEFGGQVLRYGDNDFLMADILWRISRNLMADIESRMAIIKRPMADIASAMANIRLLMADTETLMAKITSLYGENYSGMAKILWVDHLWRKLP